MGLTVVCVAIDVLLTVGFERLQTVSAAGSGIEPGMLDTGLDTVESSVVSVRAHELSLSFR